jgi:hypothetical protein
MQSFSSRRLDHNAVCEKRLFPRLELANTGCCKSAVEFKLTHYLAAR